MQKIEKSLHNLISDHESHISIEESVKEMFGNLLNEFYQVSKEFNIHHPNLEDHSIDDIEKLDHINEINFDVNDNFDNHNKKRNLLMSQPLNLKGR